MLYVRSGFTPLRKGVRVSGLSKVFILLWSSVCLSQRLVFPYVVFHSSVCDRTAGVVAYEDDGRRLYFDRLYDERHFRSIYGLFLHWDNHLSISSGHRLITKGLSTAVDVAGAEGAYGDLVNVINE